MPCCGSRALAAQYCEKGFGKFLLILFFLALSFYTLYFAIVTCIPQTHLPDQFIELKQNRDFFLGKNEAGYGGYIRFETKTTAYPGSPPEQVSTAKIVLKFRKESPYKHGIKIELFNKTRRFLSELVLKKRSFQPLEAGYSYNKQTVQLPGTFTMNDIAYFRYSFIEE